MKILLINLICILLLTACGSKKKNVNPTPDIETQFPDKKEKNTNLTNITSTDFSNNIEKNIPAIIEDLRKDIKNIRAELDYQNENLTKLESKTQVWANPFSIYNKEIVLNNGSSVFGKIIYQDQDVMKVETLIGQLIIDRNTIVRVVNQSNVYSTLNKNDKNEDNNEDSGINLIQKRLVSQAANLVLIGDIQETKDASGNTLLKGEIKNVGNKRADFAKIIFTFRINWQGDTKTLTTFIDGITNTFDTGISSDNSVLPHAIGTFELMIPKSFGSFIGYSYDIDWSQYDG